MKIGRQYVGKFVEFVWRDPNCDRDEIKNARKGREAMATWHERGIIDDITDGVVRVVHSAAQSPGATEIDEITYTVVDEALIERITIYEPVRQEPT